MSAKNRDNKNRWRNITVGFRVSPEENERINKAVALSGLPKQEYCYRRCLNQDVVEITFCDCKNAIFLLQSVEHIQILLHFFTKELRHFDSAVAFLFFRCSNHIFSV